MDDKPRPIGPQPWEQVRTRLDQSLPFANMRDTPYYRDAVYEQFSKAEYARRYAALRDCVWETTASKYCTRFMAYLEQQEWPSPRVRLQVAS